MKTRPGICNPYCGGYISFQPCGRQFVGITEKAIFRLVASTHSERTIMITASHCAAINGLIMSYIITVITATRRCY